MISFNPPETLRGRNCYPEFPMLACGTPKLKHSPRLDLHLLRRRPMASPRRPGLGQAPALPTTPPGSCPSEKPEALGFGRGKDKAFLGVAESHLPETPRLKEDGRDILTLVQSKREKVRGRLNIHRIEQSVRERTRTPQTLPLLSRRKLEDQSNLANWKRRPGGAGPGRLPRNALALFEAPPGHPRGSDGEGSGARKKVKKKNTASF